MPGAQQAQRQYIVETTQVRRNKAGEPITKGYRIVPSIDPTVSAIERALKDAGVTHYMPATKRVIRNRRKTGSYTTKRLPLLPGYVFVSGVVNSQQLAGIPGVAGIVGCEGVPYPISVVDIMALRTVEAHDEAAAEIEIAKLEREEDKAAKKATQKALTKAKRVFSSGSRVRVLWGEAIGREATILNWSDTEKVNAIVAGLESAGVMALPFDTIRLVEAA